MTAIPNPASRIGPELYLEVREWLLAHDPDGTAMFNWSQQLGAAPKTAEQMAGEIIWIILCAGRSAQAARTIETKVWDKINSGQPVVEAFGYRAKAAAIERAWRERDKDFSDLRKVLAAGDVRALVDWAGSLPFVGDDTKFQLAKNFGADLCKPDIWLCRLTGIPDRPRLKIAVRFDACMSLCRPLAEASGDRIATVDSMLWLACNKGTLVVSAEAGPIEFVKTISRAKAIMASGVGEQIPGEVL